MMLVSATGVSPSSSTGISRSGHSRASSSKVSGRSSSRHVNGVAFSYSATSTFWVQEENGWP